ncbi:uncharacterized protein LOC110093479 isoform X3 [Dendrobium catenatum]|uniref:uncharacterized protein LOC110093479 isoform X3 n=1 Tax=Dendrobium catenatum TaxID=906689 RepID=UPI0010A05C9F|nr:uncharacterized protein LOC110093479 isoform X3 [Dendrobium catenatum]
MKPLPLLSLSGALPSRSQALDRMNLRSSSFRSHKPDGMKPSYCPRRTITATDPLLRTDWIRMLRLRKSFERVGKEILPCFYTLFLSDQKSRWKLIMNRCQEEKDESNFHIFKCIGCSWLQV